MIAWKSQKILSNQQHSSLKTEHFNKWSHYLLLSIIIRSIIKIFIMIQSFVNTQFNFFESNQSFNSVIYLKLFSHLLKFLKTDFVWKHHQFLSHFQTFNESLKVFILWDIKNVKQLQHWIKQDLEVFLEDLNNLQTQRDLNVEACELFDKILSEQIWKTCFEEINWAKERLNLNFKKLQDQMMKLQHRLRLTKEDTSTSFIMFNSFKWFQKLSNSSLFTDETESFWDDWQEKIHDKLEINVNHFDTDRVILIYIYFRIDENVVKVTLAWCQHDSLNLYRIINDLLNELAQLYNDLDKETNFQREYANLIQEKSKFSDFYSIFQRLFFYLKYHEKQLIIDLQDKIVYHLHTAWSNQLIQSESFNEIHSYLIHLNNEHRVMNDIKEKKFLIKVRKQVIFAEKWDSLNFYRKIEVTTLVNHSKSCNVILINIKDIDFQVEICFICYKSNYTSKEYSDRSKVNALKDDEFNQFTLNFESDSDSKN